MQLGQSWAVGTIGPNVRLNVASEVRCCNVIRFQVEIFYKDWPRFFGGTHKYIVWPGHYKELEMSIWVDSVQDSILSWEPDF